MGESARGNTARDERVRRLTVASRVVHASRLRRLVEERRERLLVHKPVSLQMVLNDLGMDDTFARANLRDTHF